MTYGVLAALLTLPAIGLANRIRRSLGLPPLLLFAVTLLTLGVAAEAAFFMTMVSDRGTIAAVWIAAIAGTVAAVSEIRDPARRAELRHVDNWAPFGVTFAAGLAFIALLAISVTPGASSISFAQVWLIQLPDDNLLPHLLAHNIAAHAPAKPFLADWLSSDRPPLQAGFELLLAALTPYAADADARYQALAMLLQSTAFGILFTLCRLNNCSGLRSGFVTLLAATTGFAFVNTVFVWPKLLAAALMIVAVAIYLAPGVVKRGRALAIGTAVGLALLSHAGVAFTLPAFAMAILLHRGRRAGAVLGIAFCAVLLLNAPWSWYQKVYDPPGDRLLKWHLAGQIAVTNEGFFPTLYRAYVDVPKTTILSNKIANIKTLFGTTLGPLSPRGREFFYVGDALGVLGYPFVCALVFIRSKRRTLRAAAQFAWIAVGSLTFWALLLYLPKASVVHVGSNATMLLMFLASGIVVTEWAPVGVIFLAWQLFHFSTVWLTAVDLSHARTLDGAVAILVLIAVIGGCCAAAVKPLIRRIAPLLTANSTKLGGTSKGS